METGQARFPEYADAFAALAEIVGVTNEALGEDGPGETTVYVYGDEKIGVRISEIGTFWPSGARAGSGMSYMRSEPDHGNAILAAESFLLEYGAAPEGWDVDAPIVDYANESRWRLAFALTEGSKLDRVERDALYEKILIPRRKE